MISSPVSPTHYFCCPVVVRDDGVVKGNEAEEEVNPKHAVFSEPIGMEKVT